MCKFWGAMPRPWSETATLAIPARALTWHVIGPPLGEYLIALLSRLAMIVLVRSGSTFTRTRRSGRSRSTWCRESTRGATLKVADRTLAVGQRQGHRDDAVGRAEGILALLGHQVRCASGVDARVRDELAVGVGDERSIAAEQAHRPGGRTLGKDLASRTENEQVLDRRPKLVLLPHAPDAAKQCRGSKADVDRRYHHKHNQLCHDDRRRAAQRATAANADEQDRDENRETKAQKAHPRPLHSRKVSARQPEPGNRLPGEDCPCADALEHAHRRDPRIGMGKRR